MASKERPEIFTDEWRYSEVPQSSESREKIDYEHMVALGSCFARNLNRWLNFNGYSEREMPWDILYNPFSIQKEIERLYQTTNWEQNVLHEMSGDGQERFRDPWRTWNFTATKAELKEKNDQFDVVAKNLLNTSNSFLITLGLSEIWSPIDDPDIVLNQVPVGSIRLGEKEWVSRFATVEDVYNSLLATVNAIRENVTKNGQVIFTLSPVPLKYTASNLGVREANNLSKATILVALRKLISVRGDVDYFPSYEIVQALSEKFKESVWQSDGRHVSAKVVEFVSSKFTEVYGRLEGEKNYEKFWVPRVDKNGRAVGKLYVDGVEE